MLRQIDRIAGVVPAQVYVTTKIIAFDESKELGPPMSWLGTNSSGLPEIPKPMLEQIATFNEAQVLTLLRTVDSNWRDPNETAKALSSPPDKTGLTFSDAFRKALNLGHPQIASAPSVTMRSGQKGSVEVVREFIYPTAFERQDVAEPAGNPKIVPSSFTTQPLGIRMEIEPKVYPAGLIGLSFTPTLSAFLKWQEFKSGDGQFIRNPIFGTTTCTVVLNLAQGQTAVFGGYAYKAVFEKRPSKEVAEHPPGDALCPALVLVNAKLVGPGGKLSQHGTAEYGGIVIPSLQVSQVSLADAVSQICDLAKKHDPRGLGINLLLRSSAASDSRVTLNVTDVKLSTLLDFKPEENSPQPKSTTKGQVKVLKEPVRLPPAIGQKSFLKGDHIEILDAESTSGNFEVGDRVIVKGRYELASHNAASICLFTTQTQGDGREETDPSQRMKAEKGNHDFELSCTIRKTGYLHVSFYDLEHGNGFGGVYFGSAQQMQEFDVGDWPVRAAEKKGSVPLRAPDEPAPRFVPNRPPVTPTKP